MIWKPTRSSPLPCFCRIFLNNWGHGPLQKLQSLAPDFEFVLEDVIAIMMLCGYESVIKGRGKTDFCKASIFDAEDYRNFEYFFDLLYHKVSTFPFIQR